MKSIMGTRLDRVESIMMKAMNSFMKTFKLTAISKTARWPYNKHIYTERKAEDETEEVSLNKTMV